jgi:two-component system response regulator RegA
MTPLLFVEDDEVLRKRVAAELEHRGYAVSAVGTTAEARAVVRDWSTPGLGVVDLQLPDGSGLELITELRRRYPGMRLLLASAYCSVTASVEAMRAGAYDCLQKPYSIGMLLDHLAPGREPTAAGDELTLARVEWEHIQRVLRDADHNVSLAASRLGIDRRSLQRKLQKRPPPR